MTIKITKQLATVEDLAIGTGTVVQERNGVPLTLTKIDLITASILASKDAGKGASLVSMESGVTVEDAVSTITTEIEDRVIRATSVAELEGMPGLTDQQISVESYHANLNVGGGIFVWSEGRHNGGTFIDPLRTFPDWNVPSEVLAWFLDSGSNVSGWKRKDAYSFSVSEFGAFIDSSSESSAQVNKTIKEAYKSTASLTEVESVWVQTILFEAGRDYKLDEILIPSGIILDFNGSRIVGEYASAGDDLYDAARGDTIATAYYDTGTDAFIKNEGTALNAKRVTNSSIKNVTFVNCNMCMNLTQFNEGCSLLNIAAFNCSQLYISNACYYMDVNRFFTRQTAMASGQPAVKYVGDAANNITHKDVHVVGADIGIEFASTTSLQFSISGESSFEEGRIGVLFTSGSLQACQVSQTYFEGVEVAVEFTGGNAYGYTQSGNIYSSCEYSLKATENSIRVGVITGCSIPDEGGVIRNLLDISARGVDVIVQIPGVAATEPAGSIGNILTGSSSRIIWPYTYINTGGETIARAQSDGSANNAAVIALPFTGRSQLSVTNNPPFLTYTSPTTSTIRISTEIIYDPAQMLCFTIQMNDQAADRLIQGFIFKDVVHRLDAGAETVGVFVGTAGLPLVIELSGVSTTGASTGYNIISAAIRHL